ncbi:MAG: methylmalonyl-CoA mutase subunit beta [Flavobacteriaceae bacterium]
MKTTMSNVLFSEFDSVSAKQWKQKIQADLKGSDYNETLVWQSLEGINVRPFYHQDDFKNGVTIIPGHPPHWAIAQHVFIDDETISNTLILDAINRGAEAVYLTAEKSFSLEKVFSKFSFEKTAIYFHFKFLDANFLKTIIPWLQSKKATVFYNLDLIGHLCREGNWFHSLEKDHQILEEIISKNPSENILSVDTSLYQNAGANIAQQLAYAVAHANEYLNHFQHHKTLKITFKISVGSNYFFEIAKLRALRLLYATLASEYGFSETCHIIAIPSKRNKTLYDYNVNMLRTTTECMSAVLGGANTVCNIPYDVLYHKSNEFGERISRNQLLVLKAESYFDTVSNPADGSYYIEKLTEEIAEKALDIFKDIEKGGGFLKQLKEGTIQKKIKESAQKEQEWFDTGKLILIGTNKYQNQEDTMSHNLELYPFVKTKPRKTIIEPIIEKRISENIEKNRLAHESI